MFDVLSVIADDNLLIPYRKELNKITSSVTATILLQQMLHRYKLSNYKPFYKFIEPCDSALYKEGDSWTEELGFSVKEFKTALAKLIEIGVVSKKIDMSRVTRYEMNLDLLSELLEGLYINAERAVEKVQKGCIYPPKGNIDSSIILTEITRDNQREKNNIKKDFSFNLSKATQHDNLSAEYQEKLKGYATTKDGSHSFDSFLDYHIAKGSTFKDWSRAYNTWITNSIKFNKFNPTSFVVHHFDEATQTKMVQEYGTNNLYSPESFEFIATMSRAEQPVTSAPVKAPEPEFYCGAINPNIMGMLKGITS